MDETSASQGENELNALFAPNKSLEPDVLGELQSIMRLHSIVPQELFYKWESYSIKMGTGTTMNMDNVRAFKRDIQDTTEREMRTKSHVMSAEKRTGATPRNIQNSGDVFGM